VRFLWTFISFTTAHNIQLIHCLPVIVWPSAETFMPQPGKAHSASSPFTIIDPDIMNIRPSNPGNPSKAAVETDASKLVKKKTKAEEQKDTKRKGRVERGERGSRTNRRGEDNNQ